MRISDWSSDVCSSDLLGSMPAKSPPICTKVLRARSATSRASGSEMCSAHFSSRGLISGIKGATSFGCSIRVAISIKLRSEEHTSELQSLMRISYAVFCLKQKKLETKTRLLTKHQT